MFYCTECGARLPDDSVFCTNCGAPVRMAYKNRRQSAKERAHNAAGAAQHTSAYPPEPKRRAGDGKVAAIIISIVVILFVAAGYLLDKAVDASSFTGYWESSAVEVNGEQKDSYFGKDIKGLFGMEIRDNGTVAMCSAFRRKPFEGKWERDGSDLIVYSNNESYTLSKKDGKIYVYNDGLYIVYSRAEGDIDHPSVPHGSLSESLDGSDGNALPSPDKNNGSEGTVDGKRYYVAITGAEKGKNSEGNDILRIYFTFTNHSAHAQSAWDTLDFIAEQDGRELHGESGQDSTETGALIAARVRPDVTVDCCYTVLFDPDGGAVQFTVTGWNMGPDGGAVTASFLPKALPGAPAAMEIETVPTPSWTLALPGEGVLGDDYNVAVMGAERITDSYGRDAVRILYRFVNNSEHKISMGEALHVWTYQDGVSLVPVDAAERAGTDDAYKTPVAPGESATVSRVFRLRNTSSQIEAEVEPLDSYDAVGQTYAVNG
ncbi:MAG: DUF5067 domain-containing protein [Oscillospiraceae bacterium]|jgi:hypothetical protein